LTGLARKKRRLRYLERAVDDRSARLLLHKPHPVFATIGSEPRFERVLDRIGRANRDASSPNPMVNEMRETGAGARGASRE
jgi:hypothetical protein